MSENIKNKLKKIKNKIVGGYSPDIALRYLPVVDLIKKTGLANKKILDFGSGDLGITPYLKINIVGLDTDFESKNSDYIKKIKYSGNNFPFRDNKFDLLISVDSLEHVAKGKRQHIINEMLRVSKAIIIIVPSGKLAEAHDKKLADYFYKIYKKTNKFFNDHLKNGLPESDEIKKMLQTAAKRANKKIIIKKQKKVFNIKLRMIMMRCKISKSILLSVFYYIFLLLLPFRSLLNFGNCYRRLFYIKIK